MNRNIILSISTLILMAGTLYLYFPKPSESIEYDREIVNNLNSAVLPSGIITVNNRSNTEMDLYSSYYIAKTMRLFNRETNISPDYIESLQTKDGLFENPSDIPLSGFTKIKMAVGLLQGEKSIDRIHKKNLLKHVDKLFHKEGYYKKVGEESELVDQFGNTYEALLVIQRIQGTSSIHDETIEWLHLYEDRLKDLDIRSFTYWLKSMALVDKEFDLNHYQDVAYEKMISTKEIMKGSLDFRKLLVLGSYAELEKMYSFNLELSDSLISELKSSIEQFDVFFNYYAIKILKHFDELSFIPDLFIAYSDRVKVDGGYTNFSGASFDLRLTQMGRDTITLLGGEPFYSGELIGTLSKIDEGVMNKLDSGSLYSLLIMINDSNLSGEKKQKLILQKLKEAYRDNASGEIDIRNWHYYVQALNVLGLDAPEDVVKESKELIKYLEGDFSEGNQYLYATIVINNFKVMGVEVPDVHKELKQKLKQITSHPDQSSIRELFFSVTAFQKTDGTYKHLQRDVIDFLETYRVDKGYAYHTKDSNADVAMTYYAIQLKRLFKDGDKVVHY